ncbi:MAG: hypothetical protein ACYSWU_04970, partial [Planctomycetota bacterium]
NTQALIDDFQRIDKSGQNLRYTRDRQGRPIARKDPKSVELVKFQCAFEGVHKLLDACAWDIRQYIADAKREG